MNRSSLVLSPYERSELKKHGASRFSEHSPAASEESRLATISRKVINENSYPRVWQHEHNQPSETKLTPGAMCRKILSKIIN